MTQSEAPMPLVVVPAYNEQESVGAVVETCIGLRYPTLVVDDGSIDGTSEAARAAGAQVLRLPFNLGVGGALRCGFRWAVRNGFEAVVQCDADGQHSPHLISALEAKAEGGGFDLVIGSRFLEVSEYVPSLIRRMPMVVMANLASRAGGIRLTDTTSGFRLIREPLLSQMALQFPVHYLGDTFDATVAAARRGYRIAEVSVSMRQRNTGKASSGTAKSVLFILRSLTTYVLGGGLRYNSRPIEGG